MRTLYYIAAGACLFLLGSCGQDKMKNDASGIFESTEVMVSSEAEGKIMQLGISEGDVLTAGQEVGLVDTVPLSLQRLQLLSSMKAVGSRRADVRKQVAATKRQIEQAELERQRAINLLRQNAGTQKQVDDAEAQLSILHRQLDAQLSTLDLSNQSVGDEQTSVAYQVAGLEDRLKKCHIVSPISGTVLVKYAEAGEVTGAGKPLFKVADMKHLFLRAYVTETQLTSVKLGQSVTVYADDGEENMRSYKGRVTWIADKAEFTPKTIQTRDERANLVYAVKVAVENDGYLKLGMYGELAFH